MNDDVKIKGQLSELWRPVLGYEAFSLLLLVAVIGRDQESLRDAAVFSLPVTALLLCATLPAWIAAAMTSYEVMSGKFVVRRLGRAISSVPCADISVFELQGRPRWIDLATPFVLADGMFPRARTRSPHDHLHPPILIWTSAGEVEQTLRAAIMQH